MAQQHRYIVYATNLGEDTDNFSIYHTSPKQQNLVKTGITRDQILAGVEVSISAEYPILVVEPSGLCGDPFYYSIAGGIPSPTPTNSITPSITPTISVTPDVSNSPTPSHTATPTPTPTISITPSVTDYSAILRLGQVLEGAYYASGSEVYLSNIPNAAWTTGDFIELDAGFIPTYRGCWRVLEELISTTESTFIYPIKGACTSTSGEVSVPYHAEVQQTQNGNNYPVGTTFFVNNANNIEFSSADNVTPRSTSVS